MHEQHNWNTSFQPRNEHGKVILCANNQQGGKFGAYSAGIHLRCFYYMFADEVMVFTKGNVHFFHRFLDPFRKEHNTKQQLLAGAISSGEAFVISMFERLFH